VETKVIGILFCELKFLIQFIYCIEPFQEWQTTKHGQDKIHENCTLKSRVPVAGYIQPVTQQYKSTTF